VIKPLEWDSTYCGEPTHGLICDVRTEQVTCKRCLAVIEKRGRAVDREHKATDAELDAAKAIQAIKVLPYAPPEEVAQVYADIIARHREHEVNALRVERKLLTMQVKIAQQLMDACDALVTACIFARNNGGIRGEPTAVNLIHQAERAATYALRKAKDVQLGETANGHSQGTEQAHR